MLDDPPGHRDSGAPPSIGVLLPPGIAVAEAVAGDDPGELYAVEEAAMARAVDRRVREFAQGRTCARRALERAGLPAGPIAVDPATRAPVWPDGVVGSITHCDGYVAAAVAPRGRWTGIGIDAEPDLPLPDGVWETVLLPAEREWVAAQSDPALARLLFSAKESIFKAWYPLSLQWLDFTNAHVRVDLGTGRFTAAVPVVASHPAFAGRYDRTAGLLRTAVVV